MSMKHRRPIGVCPKCSPPTPGRFASCTRCIRSASQWRARTSWILTKTNESNFEEIKRLLVRLRFLQQRRGNVVDRNAGCGLSFECPAVCVTVKHRVHAEAVDWFFET